MKEMQEIVKAFDMASKNGLETALATVVHVEGSSYRRAGARMLVTEDGTITGAISGGCLEGDALQKAQHVIAKRKPMLVTYDTTDDNDPELSVGLGCNGIIHILIEPIDIGNPENPIQLFKTFLSTRQAAVLVTLFSVKAKTAEQPGTCFFINEEGDIRGDLAEESLFKTLLSDADKVLINQKSITKIYRSEDELTGFVELLKPAVNLIVAGAGNDAIPLMQLTKILGWKMTIVDCRSHYATEERFPGVRKIIATDPVDALSQLSPDERSAIILMTHNYKYDLSMLRELIPLQIPYIGLLGPRKRANKMMQDLRSEGLIITEEQLKHIYGPVGLDIGAESPDEIALSVIAEIKSVFSGKSGTHLREKQEPIHERESEIIDH
ncbi:MAG TPA: XdhC/CoxI family protein [Balneolales bacterium]|nr:XdhC/CoxI family protein [Balneolales bacterium]